MKLGSFGFAPSASAVHTAIALLCPSTATRGEKAWWFAAETWTGADHAPVRGRKADTTAGVPSVSSVQTASELPRSSTATCGS